MAAAIISTCLGVSASVIGVLMKPGATQFTVMFRDATSRASDLVMPIKSRLRSGVVALPRIAGHARRSR